MKSFGLWLEKLLSRIQEDIIGMLQKARERIAQYGSIDKQAASDADSILRSARGYYKLTSGVDADQNFISQITALANACNSLSYLDPDKKTKIYQIQKSIDTLIKTLTPIA